MRRIHFLRDGQHTDTHGTGVDFGEAELRAIAASYDPKVHEAPLTVGHPRDNLPAFGWVQGIEFREGEGLWAVPHQVNADFDELARAGSFKKVSASIYMPDHPNNPTPGKPYLRHIGFLGAQPPAIKGLEPLQFAEDDDGEQLLELEEQTTDLADMRWEMGVMATITRRLREWFIDKHDLETADGIVPEYLVSDLEEASRTPPPDPNPKPAVSFSDPPTPTGDDTMTKEQLEARAAELDAREATFAERETAIVARESALSLQEHRSWADKMVGTGKLTPAERDPTVALLASMSTEPTVEFAEGDTTTKISPVDAYRKQIEARAKVVDFEERAGDDKPEPGKRTPKAMARAIQDYRAEEQAKGRVVSFTEASAHVRQSGAA